MRYIVIFKDKTSFQTAWFEYEKHWMNSIYCVVDTCEDRITFDGENWQEIDYDHL